MGPSPDPRASGRLLSLDAYRGFIMLTLVANGFGAVEIGRRLPDSGWAWLGRQFLHTPWVGCVFYDVIMPAFLLMIGVAMPFSRAKRERDGDSAGRLWRHAIARASVL